MIGVFADKLSTPTIAYPGHLFHLRQFSRESWAWWRTKQNRRAYWPGG
jgi:hypothetical protein